MLRIDIDEKRGSAMVEASGSVMDTAADFLFAVASVYQTLKANNPALAENLQTCIQIGVMDPEIWEHPHNNGMRVFVPRQRK